MESTDKQISTPTWIAIGIIAAAIYMHNRVPAKDVPKPSPTPSERITTEGLIVDQALLERQLEGRLYWDCAKRLEAGEFTITEARESFKERAPYAEGESRIALDTEMQTLLGFENVKASMPDKTTDAEVEAEQIKRYIQAFREYALEADPSIEH